MTPGGANVPYDSDLARVGGISTCPYRDLFCGASRTDPVAARDSVAHDLVEDERVEPIRGAPAAARPRAASEDGDVLLVDLRLIDRWMDGRIES